MTLTYELWDTTSRNLVAEFGSRDEALSSVREALRTHGHGAVEILALGTEDGDGGGEVIARGAELAALARGDSGGSSPPPAPSTPARRNSRPGTVGGYGFDTMDTFTRIAATGSNITDLLGPRLADMMIPRFTIPTDTLVPCLAIPKEIIDPIGSSEIFKTLAVGSGLQSFGKIDWGRYFITQNDDFLASINTPARQSQSILTSAVMQEWTHVAGDIARLLAALGRQGDGAILALARDPEKRFAYRATDEIDYLGGIDSESGDDPDNIRIFRWWTFLEGKMAS